MDFAPPSVPTSMAGPATILVVDDEVLLCMVAADFLRERGYRVIEANTGDNAVNLLQSAGHVDAVFTDIQMPGAVDGIALARWISRERPHTHVVLTSGGMRPAEVVAEIGDAVTILAKPYGLPEVAESIAALLPVVKLS